MHQRCGQRATHLHAGGFQRAAQVAAKERAAAQIIDQQPSLHPACHRAKQCLGDRVARAIEQVDVGQQVHMMRGRVDVLHHARDVVGTVT